MALNSNFRTLTADNMEGVVSTRNYLKNSFENGSLTGWTELSVALTSGLPTGTPTISATAASSLALSVTSTTPLSLDKSLLVSVPSALTAGQGFISDAFTLDRMDLGKVITVSFDYERISGTYNFSGTLGSQTWMVYVYDVTAGGANWIQPAGFLGMNQSSSAGRVACTFQSSVVAGQQYRIAVIASQAAAGASSIEFDNFTASRQTAPIGPVVTDWVDRGAIIITGSTSNPTKGATSVDKMWTRRVGDNLEVRVEYVQSATGTAGSGDYLISLPSGFSIDTNKVTADSAIEGGAGSFTQNNSVGLATIQNVNSAAVGSVFVHDATRLRIGLINSEATGNTNSVGVWASNYYALTTGDFALQATFSVPLAGASSNVQLSNDTDTRVVAASYSRSNAQSILAATDTVVIYDTRRIDTHAAMNTSNGRFYAPVSGVYRITASVFYNFFTPVAGNPLQLRFRKRDASGAVIEDLYKDNFTANAAVGQEIALRSAAQFYCNAGEQLEVVLWQNTGGTRTTIAGINFVEIERLSGPSVIAANEVVEATYQALAGNVMNNGTEMWLDYGTKIRDTHNAVSGAGSGNKTVSNAGWKFTAPITGRYYVNAVFHVTSGAVANSVTYGYIAVNGAAKSHSDIKAGQNPAGDAFGSQINGEVFMNAGDYLEVVGYQANGANRNQQVVNIRNQVEIVRVGAY